MNLLSKFNMRKQTINHPVLEQSKLKSGIRYERNKDAETILPIQIRRRVNKSQLERVQEAESKSGISKGE